VIMCGYYYYLTFCCLCGIRLRAFLYIIYYFCIIEGICLFADSKFEDFIIKSLSHIFAVCERIYWEQKWKKNKKENEKRKTELKINNLELLIFFATKTHFEHSHIFASFT
jgi:hypothetical protein